MKQSSSFTEFLFFSIIGGYIILAAALFWFLSVISNTSYQVYLSNGSIDTVIIDPIRFFYGQNGVVYAITFGVSGAIFLYLFLVSPVVEKHSQTFGAQEHPSKIGGMYPGKEVTNVDRLHMEQDSFNRFAEEQNAIFEEDTITLNMVRKFVRKFPQTSLMFALRKKPDGSALDENTLNTFRNWENFGLNKQVVTDEIKNILNTEILDDTSELSDTLELLNKAIATENFNL